MLDKVNAYFCKNINLARKFFIMEPKRKRWFTNKYVVAFMFFAAWMLFFDKNNLLVQWKLQRKLRELQREEKYYQMEIEKANSLYYELQKYPERYIKYIREKFLFKKENEDIFLLIYDKHFKK